MPLSQEGAPSLHFCPLPAKKYTYRFLAAAGESHHWWKERDTKKDEARGGTEITRCCVNRRFSGNEDVAATPKNPHV